MRRIRIAATVLGPALLLAACQAAASPAPSVLDSAEALPTFAPSEMTTSPGPSGSAPASAADTTDEVVDAALATLAKETLRFAVDIRSADPDDTLQPVTGTGQVSFGDPSQFRFASAGIAGTVPPTEVIFDGERLFSRGRDTPYLPEDTWVVLDVKQGTMGQELITRQYGDYSLVLVAPLGVTSAATAGAEPTGSRELTRYVTQVDIAAARPHLPASLLPAYESQLNTFNSAGVPLTHEVEVWVDAEGHIARTRYVQELEGQDIDALVVTYDFDDYGASMEVAPPDGAEVLTIDEVREYRASLESPSPTP